MKYLIIGAGAVGASIGAFLSVAKKDVTLVARGKHLQAIKQQGLKIKSDMLGSLTLTNINAFSQDEFEGKADVIFVCVKSYSIEEICPIIEKSSKSNTIVIPVLNTFKTGEKISAFVKTPAIFDGCIYIVSQIEDYGIISQTTNIFKIVFGETGNKCANKKTLQKLKQDLTDSQISFEHVNDINSAKFEKFSLTSAFASNGAFFDIEAKDVQTRGVYRNSLIKLLEEMKDLACAMNLNIKIDVVNDNLKIIDKFNPTATASMQRDLKYKPESEINGLLFDVLKLGGKYNVKMPHYQEISEKFQQNRAPSCIK